MAGHIDLTCGINRQRPIYGKVQFRGADAGGGRVGDEGVVQKCQRPEPVRAGT